VTDCALADTSVFIARETRRPINTALIPDELEVSVITLAELRSGVLLASNTVQRDQRLRTLAAAMTLRLAPVTAAVAEQWATLRVLLLDAGKRMEINDSWIAATAMALGMPVLTQDDGFARVEGLEVISV